MWTHYLALFAVGSLLLANAGMRRWRNAAALACGYLLFLPWAPVLAAQPSASMGWLRDQPVPTAYGFLADLGGSARLLPPFGFPLPGALLTVAEIAAVIFLVLLVIRLGSDSETRIGLAAVLLTLGGVFAASFVSHPIAVAGRTELAILPIWLWIAARAGETSRAARLAAAAVASIGIASSLLILAAPRPNRPFADVPGRLLEPRQSAETSRSVPAISTFRFSSSATGAASRRTSVAPGGLAAHPGLVPRAGADANRSTRPSKRSVGRAAPERSVFLLLDPPFWNSRLKRMMAARGEFSAEALPYGILVSSPPAGR